MMRRLRDRIQYIRDCGYIQVGPLVFTTWDRHAYSEWNAFRLGWDIGHEAGRPFVAPLVPVPHDADHHRGDDLATNSSTGLTPDA